MGTLAGVPLGWGLWTAVEYAGHRWAMHGAKRNNPLASEHRRHHADPEATDPRLRTLGYAVVAVGSFSVGRGIASIVGRRVASGMSFGLLSGYGSYETLHWRSHHRAPANGVERWVHARHSEHHARPGINLGIITSVWDHLAGTEATTSVEPQLQRR